jgi:aspartate aminotransferase-like enzyme
MGHLAERQILMTPGPVTVSPAVLEALATPIMFHRYEDFRIVHDKACDYLKQCFDAPDYHQTVLFSGSGSLANEIVLSSVFERESAVVVPSNGVFGERLAAQLVAHGIRAIHLRRGMLAEVDVDEIMDAAMRYQAAGIALVALETSTGMVNPIAAVARAMAASGRQDMTLFVDAVSALGCEDLSVRRLEISHCTSVPNKAIGGVPGLSFACIDTQRIKKSVSPTASYLDLHPYLQFGARGETPTTPSTPQIHALIVALEELAAEGIANRRARHAAMTAELISQLEPLEFLPAIEREDSRSAAVTAFLVRPDLNVDRLRDYLRERGLVVWFPPAPVDEEARRLMVVAVMGQVTRGHVRELTDAIADFLGADRDA